MEETLAGVSRSFFLTLRLLPEPMRGPASLGYLLARTSDTLADTADAPVALRLSCLDAFRVALAGQGVVPDWPSAMTDAIADPRERRLMEQTGALFDWLDRMPTAEARLVREVAEVITGGQALDLERFATADAAHPVALAGAAALEDYAWRVAGCVGVFWTKLGCLVSGGRFSSASEEVLLRRGAAYGAGLQLVNILRDLPRDLAQGRCYLPARDPRDTDELLRLHAAWSGKAMDGVREGFAYARSLRSRRIRVATVLPAMIAAETLERMRGAGMETLRARVKVPRRRVWLALVRAWAGAWRVPAGLADARV